MKATKWVKNGVGSLFFVAAMGGSVQVLASDGAAAKTQEFPAVEFTDPADPALSFRTVAPMKKGGITVRALKADQNLPNRLELIVRDKDGTERKVELSALAPNKKGPKFPEFRGHYTPESGDWGSVMGFELRFNLPQAGKKSIPGTKLERAEAPAGANGGQ